MGAASGTHWRWAADAPVGGLPVALAKSPPNGRPSVRCGQSDSGVRLGGSLVSTLASGSSKAT